MEAEEGKKILEAATDVGIYIPNLCFLPEAELPLGACRLCFVEVEGYRDPVTSCTEPVKEGMVVLTKTPRVDKLRRTAAELIIANHDTSAECCKHKHCELQRVAVNLRVKLKPKRLRAMYPSIPIDDSNPFFLRDMNKCILCGKCVWVCNEQQGVGAIDFIRRGFDTVVAPLGNVPIIQSNCNSSGECVAVCPVAALMPKDVQWPKKEVKSVCPYCSVGCGVLLGVKDGQITLVNGDHDSPVNKGKLCVMGRFGWGFVHHPDRLTSLLVKKETEFVESSWDEALDLVTGRLSQYTSDQIGVIGSSKITNEASYLLQKLARAVLGTNNVDHFCQPCQPALFPDPSESGQGNFSDIGDADCIFVIGGNPTLSHPVAGTTLGRVARKGAKLIVASPHKVELCNYASSWLQLRPGSEASLLMGMAKVIADEGLADSASEKSLEDLDLDFVSKITGVSAKLITQAAREYAVSKPAAIVCDADDADSIQALNNLALLTGNAGWVFPLGGRNNSQGACDMGLMPDRYLGYQEVSKSTAVFEKAWGGTLNSSPGMSLAEMVEAAHEGSIKALYVVGADLLLPVADADYVREALEKLEFLVVQDMFLSETAQLADIVLPAASFVETDGTFTNFEGRVQQVRRAINPLGESRADWWIVAEIAKKLGAAGFDYKAPADVMKEASALCARSDRMTQTTSENGEVRWVHHWKGDELAPASCEASEGTADKEYPFLLSAERSLYCTSVTTKVDGLNELRAEELIEISPADAAALGVAEGETVRVISRRGEATVKVKVTRAALPGVVCVTIHQPGSPLNRLVGPVVGPASRAPGVKSCVVRVEKL